ncbi:MAG: helix-hairpin-helix domain-containing protein [Bacteroidota bacterium]
MNKFSLSLLFWGILGLPGWLFAQTDSTSLPDLDQSIEDIILGTETESQVDFSEFTDDLMALMEDPINLNTASKTDLQRIPGMTDILIEQLFAHCDRFGPLTTLYELQAIDGYSPSFIRSIMPFIIVREVGAKDISPGAKHPKAQTLQQMGEALKFEWLQRVVWINEVQRGYTDPDTTFRPLLDAEGNQIGQDTSLSSRYAGDRYRHYSRLLLSAGPNFSMGIIGEKDPGEQFLWNPDRAQYGYDFLAAFISLKDFGRLKRLVIGDYSIQAGQGMVLSRGLGFGKGAQVINSVKMPNHGIRPYKSVNENQLMRGAAATYAIGDLYFTGFYSRLRLDASVGDRDTLTNEALNAGSIQTSGLHRTASELANRRAILETLYGGRIEYKSRSLNIGLTQYWQQFGAPLNKALNPYNQFDFRGDQNMLSSLDIDFVYRNFNFFGEAARSASGGMGFTGGFMSSLAPTVDLSLVGRHFDKDFHSDKAYVFAERPIAAQNETGLYLGLRITPNYHWTFNTYFDQYYFSWNKFRAYYPSQGWEYMAQLEYKPKRGTLAYLRFRTDRKELNGADILAGGQQLSFLVPTRRDQFRLHFQTQIPRTFTFKTRLEFSWFDRPDQAEVSRGILLYQDVIWKAGYDWKVTARYAVFDAQDFDARIYAYENDILGFFSIPPYQGKGSRFYLILNWKASKQIEFWARVAQTRFQNVCGFYPLSGGLSEERCFVGSGLSQIQGENRTEVKLQVRIKIP